MESAEHREQVYRALKRALAEDKARTNVLEISELGLVEMTRKRVRQDLRSLLSTVCPTCKGSGITKSDATVAAEIFRNVQAKAATAGDVNGREVVIRVHPDLARYFEGDGQEGLERLARAVDRKITIQPNFADREGYEVRLRGGVPQ
jgi:ribonuclease G